MAEAAAADAGAADGSDAADGSAAAEVAADAGTTLPGTVRHGAADVGFDDASPREALTDRDQPRQRPRVAIIVVSTW